MRTAILIAWGIIALVGVAACSGSGPKSPLADGSRSPQPSSSGLYSGTARAPGSASASPGHSSSPSGHSAPASPSPTPRPTTSTSFPTAAPVTGGGGTAGFEHGGLLAVGVVCVLAGAGAFTIRRRLNRGG